MKKTKNILKTKSVFAIVPLLLFIVLLSFASNGWLEREQALSRAKAYKALALSLGGRDEIGEHPDEESCRMFLETRGVIGERREEKGGSYTCGELRELYRQLPRDEQNFGWIDQKSDSAVVKEKDFYGFFLYWAKHKDVQGLVKSGEDQIYGCEKAEGGSRIYAYEGGMLFSEGEEQPERYLDKKMNLIHASGELLYIGEVLSDEVVYSNVYLNEVKEEGLDFLLYSVRREIPFSKEFHPSDLKAGKIAKITVKAGKIKSFSYREQVVRGRVLALSERGIELEGRGFLETAADFAGYIPQSLESESLRDIPVGSFAHDFYLEEGRIVSALRTGENSFDRVRVLISSSGFSPLYHRTIRMRGEGNIKIRIGESEKIVPAGEEFTLDCEADAALFAGGKRMFISSYAPIAVTSIERDSGTPVYSGKFEVVREDQGLYLLNELEVEEYLRKVVPSEVPKSFYPEAIKAQALGARSYVYRQMSGSGELARYGAHLDDSERYQVYNNFGAFEETDAAVRETKGLALYYGNEPARIFYYSTSAGVCADASVWGLSPADYPYMKSRAIAPEGVLPDLSSDAALKAFLEDENFPAYEKEYPLYRWECSVSAKDLEEEIKEVSGIQDITVTKRGRGGNALEVRVDGESGSYTIEGQTRIRALLCNPQARLIDHRGEASSGFETLHSAFFYIEKEQSGEDGKIRFLIRGGGKGHGLGMSQNAANEMAGSGMRCEEIIAFFFEGVEIR